MKIIPLASIITLLLSFSSEILAGVEIVNHRGWKGCYRLFNENSEVIINPHTGARVVFYATKGENIIYEDREQDGKTFEDWKEKSFDPDGGRLDYGPEMDTRKLHQLTWVGPWKVEVTGTFSIRMSSENDEQLGLRSQRIFTLDPISSKLTITQIGENINNETLVRHFWGRTLVKPGGIMSLPVKEDNSRFRHGVGMFAWNPSRIEEDLEDERVWIKGGVLHFHAVGGTIKAGTDSEDGWMAYQVGKLRMLKRFPVYPREDYRGSEHMSGIFYSNGRFAEMEPCGPTQTLEPGDSFSFTEMWELEVLGN